MLSISAISKAEKNKLSTDSCFLILLEIRLQNTVYICYNNEYVVWKGQLYQAFPFNIGETSEDSDGSDPNVTLKIDNVAQGLQWYVEDSGGGVGTRGPGETKLETDKRHIRRRIEYLKNALSEMTERRDRRREKRRKDGVVTVAIVGYTNAGKSTLMNTLTQARVLSEDKLFATLDPTSRALRLPCGFSVMMIDTVGLVRRLPHHLVEAFRSTLEEAAEADIILNVCDASSEEYRLHLEVTETLLRELGCTEKPIIPVFNKCDLVSDPDDLPRDKEAVRICAKYAKGIDELLAAIEDNLPVKLKAFKLLIPFDKAGLLSVLRSAGALRSEEYTAEGIAAEALVEEPLWHKVEPYSVK